MMTPELNHAVNMVAPPGAMQHSARHQQQQPPRQQQSVSPSGPMSDISAQLAKMQQQELQQRIPSPQELVYHAQQIMQNALIKRKLEEQKENYRRRQEQFSGGEGNVAREQQQIRERSNSDAKGDSSSAAAAAAAPLAFTPTAVMKKMAAERRDSDPRPQIPELRVSHGDGGGGIQLQEQQQLQDNLNLRLKDL